MSIRKEEISASSASTVQKVVSYIEQKICAQALRPGDRIPTEAELCALLGVSRTSVREAIKILESMTIIQVRRGDGTYIANPQYISFYTPWKFKMLLEGTTWQEVLAFREQMEFSILRCAFLHITEQDLSALSQNLEKTRWICQYEPGNMQALVQLDDEFHGTIAHTTHNKMLEDMYQFTFDVVSPLILEDTQSEKAVESTLVVHGLLLEALERKDLFLAAHAAHQGIAYWEELAQKQPSDRFLFRK